MLKLFKKRWILFDQAVSPYKPYVTVDYGVTSVSPRDIIGLSHTPKEIKNDEKLIELRKSVEAKGWDDDLHADLHLVRLPNGKYAAAGEANHLSYLSDQLDIPKINAHVSILIPEEYIPENIKVEMEEYSNKEYLFEKRSSKLLSLAKFLNLLPKEDEKE